MSDPTAATTPTAAAMTLGCRLNQADTALMFDRLRREGFAIVRPESPGPIDVLIVNTCTVTGTAAHKSRQAVRRFRRRHPESCIVVTGCSAAIDKLLWEKEDGVDLLLPNTEKVNLVAHLQRFRETSCRQAPGPATVFAPVFRERAAGKFPFKSRALLKVQEGCNAFCTYCIVPYARGRERSRDWDEIVAEFQAMLAAGYREVVITGVNVCTYRHRGRTLVDLLRQLASFPGDYRIRLSSTEPHPDNRNLLAVMAETDKICRFLHLSAQHGSDPILKAMNRHYTAAEFAAFVAAARERIPDIHIGTDMIVGFPGETDALFQAACDFARTMAFANAHIFTFSPREGTPAATFPAQVPAAVAAARHDELRRICDATAREFRLGQVGKVLPVLFENRNRAGEYIGWSDNYVQVAAADPDLRPNTLCRVRIAAMRPDGMLVAGKI
ncbi:MAG: tRNA (N(6)-L-threonylcarbamoyladenosine(37)-C(2))-methylthiotransferase MtaB [Victivallales bacterium]|nr:tRNA (N(6)-L-threonylcarbamoyladenosine(37)-C(2))-methylthiotransferase MtaB [Victivallales bacterium]